MTSPKNRADELFSTHIDVIRRRTDRMFAGLLIGQWVAAIGVALIYSPYAWDGLARSTHPHVWAALLLGGLVSAFPVALVLVQPGSFATRCVVAVSQMLWSALLIHLTGGRIETHFHVFGSLAFLAFYRDWRVLIPASVVVLVDHFLRGLFLPFSVFGVLSASPWRVLEHGGWVVFIDAFLIASCVRGVAEMRSIAQRTTELE